MAEDTHDDVEGVTRCRIILDANILIRAVIGVRVRALVERYGDRVDFIATEAA